MKLKTMHIDKGFTLIEMAVVILIMGLLLVGILFFKQTQDLAAKRKITESRIATIQKQIASYVIRNGSLPCPAGLTTDPDTGNIGRSVDCTNSAAQEGSTEQSGAIPGSLVRIGAVPIRDLNLTEDYFIDGYGNRLVYAVTVGQVLNPYNPANGAIAVFDGTNNLVTTGFSTYTLYSLGEDGKGAITLAGASTGAACVDTGPLDAGDNENCDFDDGVFRSAGRISTQTGSATYFDDHMTFEVAVRGVYFENGLCNVAKIGTERYNDTANITEYCNADQHWLPVSPRIYEVTNISLDEVTPNQGQGPGNYHQAWCDTFNAAAPGSTIPDKAISGSGSCIKCNNPGDPACGRWVYDQASHKISIGMGALVREGWTYHCDISGPFGWGDPSDVYMTTVRCQDYPPYH